MSKNAISILFTTLIFVLALSGFGCSPEDSPVSLDKYQVEQTPATQDDATGMTIPSQNANGAQGSESQTPPPAPTKAEATSTIPPASETSSGPTMPIEPSMTETQETLAFPGILPDERVKNKLVRISTDKGDIVFELLPDEGPNAASNFVYLTDRGFYNGLTFHRVEPGFVIQGGDPEGTGRGGPGYRFADDKVNLPYKEGIVAMANAGPNTNGSQFFIMLADNNNLPPNYSIFGRVIDGMDVVKKIAVGDVMNSVVVQEKP